MGSAVTHYKLDSVILVLHMSAETEQSGFFTNDIRQLSLKWFWLSIIIIEHQKQSKTPKQPFLSRMLYDVEYLWSKLVFLSDIFHHLNQLSKKLQGRDKSIVGLEKLKVVMMGF